METTKVKPEKSAPVLERQVRELDTCFENFWRMLARSMAPPPTDVEMSPKDGRALMVIAQRGRVTMSDLAEMLEVPLSTATRMVERLIDKGLAVRSRIEIVSGAGHVPHVDAPDDVIRRLARPRNTLHTPIPSKR